MLRSFPKKLKTYWKTPPAGRYMSYREIASLSGGSIGVRIIIYCVSQMIISVGNTLIGNTIGIKPTNLYIIYIISLATAFPLTALRAQMIDNTRSMKGKYRPYIIKMGIPTVILGILFVWMPYGAMSQFMKCAVVLAFNIGFQFFYSFYNDAHESLINVLSPNSIERSDVLSIRNVVENISPSILNIFFPMFAKLITGEDTLYDIRIFRFLFPPMLLAGFAVSLFAYFNTEEKIVRAKSHDIGIRFTEAFRRVMRNKYFWIISLGSWLGFLEGAFNNIIGWMYSYQNACSSAQYSLIVAISGNACFWPNLFAPWLIRKIGKKKVLVYSNVLNIGLIAVMYPAIRSTGSSTAIWMMLVCVFINQLMTSLSGCIAPAIDADVRDYQHYVSGERIDGMFAAVGLFGNIISIVTGSVLPKIYESAGMNENVAKSLGFSGENVYDVLYNKDYFIHIGTVLITASVIGAVLNVLPYLFYDFTETKQKAVVRVLKIRAMFEDFGNGSLTEEERAEGMNVIEEAKKNAELTFIPAEELRRKLHGCTPSEKKNVKTQMKAAKKTAEEKEIALFVLQELNKFNTPAGKIQFEYAQRLVSFGPSEYIRRETADVKKLRALPHSTAEEKEIRSMKIRCAKEIRAARKAAEKYFKDGNIAFDDTELKELYRLENETAEKTEAAVKLAKSADESGNKKVYAEQKKIIRTLHRENAVTEKRIKNLSAEAARYRLAVKPYKDALRIVKQKENYDTVNI